jgi:hypothetical protein
MIQGYRAKVGSTVVHPLKSSSSLRTRVVTAANAERKNLNSAGGKQVILTFLTFLLVYNS